MTPSPLSEFFKFANLPMANFSAAGEGFDLNSCISGRKKEVTG